MHLFRTLLSFDQSSLQLVTTTSQDCFFFCNRTFLIYYGYSKQRFPLTTDIAIVYTTLMCCHTLQRMLPTKTDKTSFLN